MTDLYERALRLLSRREHSRFELRRKLSLHGSAQQVEEVLDRLQQNALLDDGRFAWMRALSCRNDRLWGSLRIRRDLKRLGVDVRIIQQILEQVNAEESESKSLQTVVSSWQQKEGVPRRAAQLKQLYDRCLRLGYPPAMVRAELERFFEHVEWKR